MKSYRFVSISETSAARTRRASILYAAVVVLSGMVAAPTRTTAQSNPPYINPVLVGNPAGFPVTVTISSPGTLQSIAVLTQGVSGLDFTNAGTGSCTAGTHYTAGETCTLGLTFTPASPGPKFGASILRDGSGNVLATTLFSGTGILGQIAFSPGVVTAPTFAGLSQPSVVAEDAAGDLFIGDELHRVLKVPPGGGSPTVIQPTVDGEELGDEVCGLTVDGAGDLFIADCANNRVVEVPVNGAAIAIDPSVNGKSLSFPGAIAVDGAGDLFIADTVNNRVVKVPHGGGAAIAIDPTVDGIGLSFPHGVAVDGADDLFVLDWYDGRVVELPVGGAPATAIVPAVDGEGLSYPHELSVDAAGDLFIADFGNNRVVEVVVNGGPTVAIDPIVNGEALRGPFGLAADGAGNLFIADDYNSRMVKINFSATPALTYASTLVGAASASQTFSISNNGNTLQDILGVSVTGADASSFVFANDCGVELGSGQSCTIHGHLAPQVAAPVTAAVTITDVVGNVYGAQQAIALSGTGLRPGSTTVSLSTGSLAFGTERLNFETDAQTVTLTNTGNESLYIGSVRVVGAENRSFMYSTTCGFNLAPGASCGSRVRFDPLATGSAMASLIFTDSGVGSPHVVSLSGTGTSSPVTAVSLSAGNLAYGSQAVGTNSASQFVTLTNTGSATLIIASIQVTGAGASSFVFANTCGSSVAAGASCMIHGHFAPLTPGGQTAAITITDNAIGSPQTIVLTGTGSAP